MKESQWLEAKTKQNKAPQFQLYKKIISSNVMGFIITKS